MPLSIDFFSPLECISHAYGSKILGILMAVIFMVTLVPYISLQLVGTGKLLEGLSGGEIGYLNGVGFMMAIVAVYLILGGMRAVAYTDVVQGIAILLGLSVGAYLFIDMNWGSPGDLFTAVHAHKPEMLTLPGPSGFYTPEMFASYCLLFGMIMFQPQLMNRMLMARDKKQIHAVGYSVLGAAAIFYILPAFFGLGAAVLYPDLTESNQVMGQVFRTISAAGLIGLIATGLILIGTVGAAMSTADSMLLAIGQILTRDVVRPFKRTPHSVQVVMSRVVMVLALIAAFVIGMNPPRLMIDLALGSVAWAAVMAPAMVGFLWPRRNAYAALASIVIGGGALATMTFMKIKPFGYHEGFICMLIAALIYVGGSYLLPPKPQAAS